MVGIALLATTSLFPAVSARYYLVFVLPVAALLARDPDGPPGSGIFDRLDTLSDRRHAVGICVSLAAALSTAQIALQSPQIYAPIAGQLGRRRYRRPQAAGCYHGGPRAGPVAGRMRGNLRLLRTRG